LDESIALVEFSKRGRRGCVETFAYAHIERFPHRFFAFNAHARAIESTLLFIVDVFSAAPDGDAAATTHAYQVHKPANCAANTTATADACVYYADVAALVDDGDATDYVWKDAANRVHGEFLRFACARAEPGADGAPRVDLHPAQLYLPASASWEDLADHDPGELYLPDVHLFGADCSAEASPRTDPVANWAWPINVDRDLPLADFLASFEAYKVGVTGL
jgi:hypothetical protein